MNEPLFNLGQIVATPGALDAFAASTNKPEEFLQRHWTGDWGELDADDKWENDLSVHNGTRILSAYMLSTGIKIWVITEADRSVTTFLLPDEY